MIDKVGIDQLEEAIDDFEEHWSPESRGAIVDLLASYGLLGDQAALTEIIRIDIELRYKHGLSIQLDEYLDPFGELLKDPGCIAQIAFEDFRSRYAHGHPVSPMRWRHLPGIRNEIWFQQLASQVSSSRWETAMREARSFPQADLAFQEALETAGFRLVHEIGQGAFSRVYLATQQELAGRYVVLKVVNKPLAEPQSMAMLQHTNIVPIYSFHRILSHSVICMPYAGSVTLEDFLKDKDNRDLRGGESLVVTVHNRVNDTTVDCEGRNLDASVKPVSLIPAADEQAVLKPLDQLRSLDCNELAIWIFGRLASALAHSHARGVLHGDLKPGNVLIRNDGEPALLDFNLSQTIDRPTAQHAGGTLPYMAPESLRALMGQAVTLDGSSDLYALGVMLFEFVTGRLPYPVPRSLAPIDLQPAIDARKSRPDWQPEDSVSPGLRSIIDRTLEFVPDRRYGSAEELQQDLECERNSRSLAHATEPRGSRVRKWVHRHPRLISSGSVGAMLLALLIPIGVSAAVYRANSLHMSAMARFDAFADESAMVLSTVMVDPRRHDGSVVVDAIKPLQEFGVLDGSGLSSFASPRMSEAQRTEQRDTLLRHVVHVAIAETDRLRPAFAESPLGDDQLNQLDQLIAAADRIRGDSASRACGFLHAERARLAGDHERFETLQTAASRMDRSSDNETYMEAVRLMSARQWSDAVALLKNLKDRDHIPSGLRWTMIGRSQYNAGQAEDAKLSITQSIEHAPESSRLWFLRGLCYYKLDRPARAERDFSQVLELEPTFVPAWLHRGIARLRQGHVGEGIADLSKGLEYSPEHAQLLLNRSKAYRKLGMTEEADRDREAVVQSTNRSASSLYSRAKVLKDDNEPEQALKDLDEVYRLDPDFIGVLPAKARVYSTKLKDPETAIEILDRAVKVDRDTETAIIDRAVVLAQVGRYEDAKADIKGAFKHPQHARSLYQAACAKASMPGEESRREALSYLAWAITAGYDADRLDKDPDLDPLRQMKGFYAIQRTYFLAKLGRRQHNPTSSDAKR